MKQNKVKIYCDKNKEKRECRICHHRNLSEIENEKKKQYVRNCHKISCHDEKRKTKRI